ncbi:MAG TPA: transglycosylase domain-containing protein [Candidatus Limnocylindria bacterium]|nr:transglycosylase domain-containing protein [Candidatus Limnocylindria bacterium]
MNRPRPRPIRPSNGHRRPNGNLRRLALARARAKPKPAGSSAGLVGLISLLFVLVLGFGVVGSTVAAGGVALFTLDAMEQDLPNVASFEELEYAQPSVVLDRSGTVELARFQSERRRVVNYDDIPQLVLDAHIAVEDRSFWDNEGYDPNAIMAAVIESVAGIRDRGASTITQQYVRARLLPAEVLAGDIYERKIKEILQSRNLTLAFPGEEGKERIITAYLNQIYYGHNAYGIAAAAEVYFGVTDMDDLTPAQAAILAGLPQAPDSYDLFKWAEVDSLGRLVVPTQAEAGERLPTPVERRNFILRNLAEGHGRWTTLTPSELQRAIDEPIVLAPELPLVYRAPHFVWHMKPQLDRLLIDRAPAERGGYRVITTLDWDAQQVAERYVTAGTVYTQLSRAEMEEVIEQEGLEEDREWLLSLRDKDIHNGALVAMDARTGDLLGYVGSAGYYRDDLASPKLDTKFDVAGRGYRQPGSAWKPLVYAAGFDNHSLTAGTLLPDVTTEFARDWVPRNADLRDRGPVLLREALKYSLNVPAIRALDRVGTDEVAALSERLGLTFPRGNRHLLEAGLAGAIGTVETNLVELTAAFGALANQGLVTAPRSILEIYDSNGQLIYQAGQPLANEALSEEAAWLTTDILKDNTDPSENVIWGQRLRIRNGDGAEVRRPAAAKTGTTNDMRDLSVYGYLAPPADPNETHLVVGVWMGNSDFSPPLGGDAPVLAADAPGRVWQAFMRDYSRDWPVADFPEPPGGLVRATIDAWSGGEPGPWTVDELEEWFLQGTQPDGEDEVDPAGILYRAMCDGWFVDLRQVEPDSPERWQNALDDWMNRARRGRNVRGEHATRTDYLFRRNGWGGPIAPLSCPTPAPPSPDPEPTPPGSDDPEPEPDPTPEPGGGGGGGGRPGPPPGPPGDEGVEPPEEPAPEPSPAP